MCPLFLSCSSVLESEPQFGFEEAKSKLQGKGRSLDVDVNEGMEWECLWGFCCPDDKESLGLVRVI